MGVRTSVGDFTFSALRKSTYYKNSGKANVILTSVQQTKWIIVSHSKNVFTQTDVARMPIVYSKFLWRIIVVCFAVCVNITAIIYVLNMNNMVSRSTPDPCTN